MSHGWAKQLDKAYRRLTLKARSAVRRAFERPESGGLIAPMREDSVRNYVSVGLTPTKLLAVLDRFDHGDLAEGLELIEQIEEKDAHVYSVAQTRRLALTGLPYEIVSAADVLDLKDRSAADAAADHCREVLSEIEHFSGILKHLSVAIGRNIAMAELVWDGLDLVDLVPVPATRIRFDTSGEEAELRVRTAQERTMGIPLAPNKWIVHTPQAPAGWGNPTRGGLLRLTAACYLAKAWSLKDWLIFLEVFGMPVRVARYDPSATPSEKEELLRMLEKLGADAAGIFSKAVELEIKEVANRGTVPYEGLCNFLNRELSKAWLGQTLTTEQGTVGSQALGNVHNEVRKDLLEADIENEGETIRRDLLKPIIEARFGPETPVPFFRRRVDESRDVAELVDTVARSVNELGLPVDRNWYAAQAGLKLAEKAEDAIPPRPVATFPGLSLKDAGGRGQAVKLILATSPADPDLAQVDRLADAATGAAGEALRPLVERIGMWLDELIERGGTLADVPAMLAEKIPSLTDVEIAELAALLEKQLLASGLRGREAVYRILRRRGGEAQT